MMHPDFPMRPPMRDAWQSRRKAMWPGGMKRGGCGGLRRLVAAAALKEGGGGAAAELCSCIILMR